MTATDISLTAVAVANEGCYSQRYRDEMLPAMKNEHFRLTDGRYEVAADLRYRVCFVRANILALNIAAEFEMDVSIVRMY